MPHTHRDKSKPDQATVNAHIEQLQHMPFNELREEWLKLQGKPAPKAFRRDMLQHALAYQIQIKAYGGLSPTIKQRLRQIAEAAREGKFTPSGTQAHILPGTKLLRQWQGKTYTVIVQENGFEWEGECYGSLSTIASKITGTNWNGWVFFGVKRRPQRNKNAAKLQRAVTHG